MPDKTTQSVLDVHAGRMVGDGIHVVDLDEILSHVETWDDWYPAWARMGERYEELAEKELAAGHAVTAGEYYWQACMSYHYGQFLFFHRRKMREEGQRRKEELYRKAAPLMVPKAERFAVPIDDTSNPGFLRLPPGGGPFPTAVLLGGLESTKEESYLFENMLLRRGVATLAFDGPGQGEMFFEVTLQPDFERYTTTVLDWMATRPEIDMDRVGILGRSLGGYYGIRSAAADPRLKACVAWGAVYELSGVWDRLPELTRKAFGYVSGYDDDDEAYAYLSKVIDLSGLLEKVTGALLVVHGELDAVWPADQARRMYEEAVNSANREVWIDPKGNHCCHNLYPVIRPAMADWLVGQLHG